VGGAITGLGIPASTITRVIGVAKAYTTRVGNGPFPTEQEDSDGAKLQKRGQEYGSTTGRARRCGWLDLPLLAYGAQLNGYTELWVTKLDVLDCFEFIPVATKYSLYHDHAKLVPASAMMSDLSKARPVYQKLQGWQQDISTARNFGDLPQAAQDYLRFIEQSLGIPITLVGVGPDREQCIHCPKGIG
jgi:adenylosuccinate synthase